MSELRISGRDVPVNDEGFLEDPNDWTPDVAEALADAEGIALTDRHWQVITFCREDYAAKGQSPGVRRITKVGGVPTKEVYALFPGGPGKLAARLAGLPKPTGCV
jgi:TusE/DsrC/DsvC family sulfur relay protein